jgi:serine/threonine-protein kinase RsbW
MGGNASEQILQRVFPSTLGVYHAFIDEVLAALKDACWEQKELFAVHMALEESISNAIRHGNKQDAAKKVTIECRTSERLFWAQICDEGQGYCREKVPDCTRDDRLEVAGGRGLALIEAYMDEVRHNERGNCVTMSKRRGAEPPSTEAS